MPVIDIRCETDNNNLIQFRFDDGDELIEYNSDNETVYITKDFDNDDSREFCHISNIDDIINILNRIKNL